MVRITVASMLAFRQGKSRVMLRPAGLIGGGYIAASCAKALGKKFWLHHIWGCGEIFATRRLPPRNSAVGRETGRVFLIQRGKHLYVSMTLFKLSFSSQDLSQIQSHQAELRRPGLIRDFWK